MDYGNAKSSNEPQGLGQKEASVLQTLVNQFEKANAEQNNNCDRLMSLHSRLNLEPPSPEMPIEKERKGITSGEGLLAALEGFVNRYQQSINVQHSVISKLERLL